MNSENLIFSEAIETTGGTVFLPGDPSAYEIVKARSEAYHYSTTLKEFSDAALGLIESQSLTIDSLSNRIAYKLQADARSVGMALTKLQSENQMIELISNSARRMREKEQSEMVVSYSLHESTLSSELDSSRANQRGLETQIGSAHSEIYELKNLLQIANQEADYQENRATNFSSDAEALRLNYQQLNSETTQQISSLQQKVTNLDSLYTSTSNENQVLKQDGSLLNSQITSYSLGDSTNTEHLISLRFTLRSANEEYNYLSDSTSQSYSMRESEYVKSLLDIQEERDSLTEHVSKVEGDLTQITLDRDSLKLENKNLVVWYEEKIELLDCEIDKLVEAKQNLGIQENKLRQENTNLSTSLIAIQSESEKSKSEITNLQTELESTTASLSEISEQNKTLSMEKDRIIIEYERKFQNFSFQKAEYRVLMEKMQGQVSEKDNLILKLQEELSTTHSLLQEADKLFKNQ